MVTELVQIKCRRSAVEQLDGFTTAFKAIGPATGIQDQLLSNSTVSADWSMSLRVFFAVLKL